MLWILLALGCAKPAARLADASLPEEVATVEALPPAQIVQQATESLDPSLRARAMALVLARGNDLDTWGTRAIWDPSPWVLVASVDAMAGLDPLPVALLEPLAEREGLQPTVRALAALALPAGTVDLHNAWVAATAPWDRAPLALAAMHHGDPAAEEALGEALATGELDMDLAFLEALGDLGGPGLLPSLAKAQSRVDPSMAIPLAAARLQLGDPKAEVDLRKAMNGDAEERLEVLDLLASHRAPAADDLIHRAQTSGPDVVRTYADLLVTAREGTHPERLRKSQEDPDREIRLMGVWASQVALQQGPASRTVAKEARRTLVIALSDPDLQVRAVAARAVGELGVEDTTAALELLLTDEVEWVRLEAAGALLGR